ncbi:tetratricopeptide repeat protein [Actinophytocola sp.]|jgi:tetratricopeptide (TPR) repeat protein|uniref:tetratricopeptide repeat protein n=1 Tax=Actinophytocola sp. TaxID=1872138 RepID=UPI002EDAE63B
MNLATAAGTEAEADALLRAGRLRDAAAAYRQVLVALERDCPHEIDRLAGVRHRLAWSLLRTGRSAEALALYERYRTPFDHHTWRMLGDLYAEAGRLAEAEHCYQTLLAWVTEQVIAQYASMIVLARVIHGGLTGGTRLVVLAPLRERLHRRGALWRRRSLGLPMLWSLLATVYERRGEHARAVACRESFRRYWAWYAGADHPSVLALGANDGGASHA